MEYEIRTTKWFKNTFSLMKWKEFLEGKGYQTIVIVRLQKGKPVYALYWNLSDKEKKEIEEGKYILKNESLMKAFDNRIMEEKDRWRKKK